MGEIINWWGLSRMTNEIMVRRAKSAKIGKTLTAYLILSADRGKRREGLCVRSVFIKKIIFLGFG